MTQVESLDDVSAMAEEARTLWIETEYELGHDIPLPSYPAEYSGKFNVRLSKSLHRSLVEAAERNGVSLNHYVSDVLARGDAQAQIERRLEDLAQHVDALGQALQHSSTGASEFGSGLARRDDEAKLRTKLRDEGSSGLNSR